MTPIQQQQCPAGVPPLRSLVSTGGHEVCGQQQQVSLVGLERGAARQVGQYGIDQAAVLVSRLGVERQPDAADLRQGAGWNQRLSAGTARRDTPANITASQHQMDHLTPH